MAPATVAPGALVNVVAPSGGAKTGDGASPGAVGGSTTLEAGALVLAAGLFGVVALRRRRAGSNR